MTILKVIRKNIYSFLLSFHIAITLIYLSHHITDEVSSKVLQLLYNIIIYVPTHLTNILTDDFRGILEKVSLVTFLIPVIIQNLYAAARFANIFRTVISTNFFTKKRYIPGTIPPGNEPFVTIQICSYNEGRVVEKTIKAACSVDWPRDKLCVQLLDDSTEQKSIDIAQEVCNYWQRNGINCEYATRPDRVGYKAGNLRYHLNNIRGDFIAIMDSDHCCEPDFLRRAVPHFYHGSGEPNYEVGMVQTPWSFGNVHDNFLTETDALTSDIHHVIEQQGRSNALGCFSFNGTGGIWRKDAIIAGGGFSSDTVTEDLDLSYKSHLAGYQFVYLPDLPQQLETPACVLAYKQQKNRWNKGYFQVYRKSMRHILECSHLPIVTRIEAFFHISSPITCFLGLLIMLMSPIMILIHNTVPPFLVVLTFIPSLAVIISGTLACYYKVPATNGLYSTSWERTKRLRFIPMLLCMAMGTSIYDTRAIWQGMTSDDATFLRTPKAGDDDDEEGGGFDLFEKQEHTADGDDGDQEALQEDGVEEEEKKRNLLSCCVKDEETKTVMYDMIFVLLGIIFAAYLLYVPFVDLFIWTWDTTDTPLYTYLLPLSLILPASALLLFHGKIFYEMDKSLLVAAAAAAAAATNNTDSDHNKVKERRRGARKMMWQLMLVIGYAILSTVYLYHDSAIHERRFGNIIRMKMKYRAMSIDRRMSFFGSDPDAPETNPLHKGYCNWGPEGTAASSTCAGGAQGGAMCNMNSQNCNSCGGRWCYKRDECHHFQCPARSDISKAEMDLRNEKLCALQTKLKAKGYQINLQESSHYEHRGYATYESSIWQKPATCLEPETQAQPNPPVQFHSSMAHEDRVQQLHVAGFRFVIR